MNIFVDSAMSGLIFIALWALASVVKNLIFARIHIESRSIDFWLAAWHFQFYWNVIQRTPTKIRGVVFCSISSLDVDSVVIRLLQMYENAKYHKCSKYWKNTFIYECQALFNGGKFKIAYVYIYFMRSQAWKRRENDHYLVKSITQHPDCDMADDKQGKNNAICAICTFRSSSVCIFPRRLHLTICVNACVSVCGCGNDFRVICHKLYS